MGDEVFLDWEQALAAEKHDKFRGSANIKLDVLEPGREVDEQNAKRLQSLFKKGGHYRVDSRNHVVAVIDQRSLDAAIIASGLSAHMLLDNPQSCYKELNFPPGFQLKCLHGLDSARAAAQSLPPGNRRWVVDLFVGDISRDLETALTEQYACEKEPDAGEFYTLIRQHQQTGHALFEQLWWARLEAVGPRRKQNMDRILKNPHYRAAFDCQLDMPGLAGGMNLGTVHHMFAMKCDEENLRYLKYVKDTWSRILGNDPRAMKKLDRRTVKTVELTAPGACPQDEARLHCELTKGCIFGGFTEEEREDIWRELLAVSTDRLIPSLYTFFEDARYLRGPAECVKRLVEGSPGDQLSHMVKNSFTGVNQESDICMIQVTESQLEARPGNVDDQVEMGYRHWWHFAMRNYDDVPVRKKKAAGDWLAQPAKSENVGVLSKGATLVYQIGFETRHIRDLAQHPTSCDAGFVPEVPSIYKQPKRCGIPRSEDQQRDKPLLYTDALHRGIDTSAGVTSFFVRRSVYLAFFGQTRRLVTESNVMNRVLIISTEQTDRTEPMDNTQLDDSHMVDTHMADTHMAEPETEQVERTNREWLQEETEENETHEQATLPQPTQDLVQERHKVGQLLQEEQDSLDKQQQDQLARYLNVREQQNKKQQALNKEEQILQAEQQQLAAQNQQRHMELQEEQQRLDRLTNNLAMQENQNQQRQTALHSRKITLEKQEQRLRELANSLDTLEEQKKQEEATLRNRETTLEKQEQRLCELANSLDTLEEQKKQEEATLRNRETTLEEQEQRLRELANSLDKKEGQNQQRQTQLEKDRWKLDEHQKTLNAWEQNNIARDEQRYNEQLELFEQEEDEQEQDKLAQDLDARKEANQSKEGDQTLQIQQQQLEQSEQGLVARDNQLTQEEQQAQELSENVDRLDTLSDHRQEEYTIQTPAWEQVTSAIHEGRPITQIGPEKRSIRHVEQDTFMQPEQEGQASKQPEPERQDLAYPAPDNSQQGLEGPDLLTQSKGRQLDSETEQSSKYMRKKPKHTHPEVSERADPAQVTSSQAEADPSQSRTAKGMGRKNRKIASSSLTKSKRITQVGGPAQQHAGHSEATMLDAKSDFLPAYIQFKIFNGKTWVEDKGMMTNTKAPGPVRTEAEKYRNEGMKLYDKESRILSIETCMEDVLQDGTNTIFLCRRGEKMPSISSPSQTTRAESLGDHL